jgi:hypothetical protein
MNELVKNLIRECKEKQELKKHYEANIIEFDNYFKYSGKIEPDKILISRYMYDNNRRCNDLHEKFIKTKDYEKLWEKNKSYSGRFAQEIEAYCWDETTNSIWSD